jgi:hypothetical protein
MKVAKSIKKFVKGRYVIMAKTKGGGKSSYVGNTMSGIKAPSSPKGGTESLRIITPGGK